VEFDDDDGGGGRVMALGTPERVRELKDRPDVRVLRKPIRRSPKRCFVIKMTYGDFRGYNGRSLLHAGVSDSRGRVYNFDERGHHIDLTWSECVAIPLSRSTCDDASFDESLRLYDNAHRDTRRQYSHRIYRSRDEGSNPGNNCFAYAVGFMNFICYDGRADHTVQSVERTYLTGPMLDAQAYLKQWQALVRANGRPLRITSGGNKPNIDALRHPHPLKRIEGDRRAWTCDGCGRVDRSGTGAPRFRCASGCDFDLCKVCWARAQQMKKTNSASHSSGTSDAGPAMSTKSNVGENTAASRGACEDATTGGSRALPIDLTNTHAEGASDSRASHTKADTTATTCRGGCGFFGRPETGGYCSVCWKRVCSE